MKFRTIAVQVMKSNRFQMIFCTIFCMNLQFITQELNNPNIGISSVSVQYRYRVWFKVQYRYRYRYRFKFWHRHLAFILKTSLSVANVLLFFSCSHIFNTPVTEPAFMDQLKVLDQKSKYLNEQKFKGNTFWSTSNNVRQILKFCFVVALWNLHYI